MALGAGQSDAFCTGYMLIKRLFVDGDHVPSDLARLILFLTTLCIAGVYALRELGSIRRKSAPALRLAMGGMLVWFAGYHLLTWWYHPVVSDFRVITLPPLVTLLALGMDDHVQATSRRGWALAVLLIVLLGLDSWLLGVRPFALYGQSVRDSYHYLRREIGASDVVMVSEWSLPDLPQVPDENVWYADSHPRARGDETSNEAVVSLRESIEDALNQGKRVLVYALVPGRYTLRNMNRGRSPNDLYGVEQFERLEAELRARHTWYPLMSVVDARNRAVYQLGRKRLTLWGICPDSWPGCWGEGSSEVEGRAPPVD